MLNLCPSISCYFYAFIASLIYRTHLRNIDLPTLRIVYSGALSIRDWHVRRRGIKRRSHFRIAVVTFTRTANRVVRLRAYVHAMLHGGALSFRSLRPSPSERLLSPRFARRRGCRAARSIRECTTRATLIFTTLPIGDTANAEHVAVHARRINGDRESAAPGTAKSLPGRAVSCEKRTNRMRYVSIFGSLRAKIREVFNMRLYKRIRSRRMSAVHWIRSLESSI